MTAPQTHTLILHARTRSSRVTVLLTAIVLLSMLDLVLTVGHMTSNGMFESNPLVTALVEWSGTALAVIDFKALSVLVGVSLLYRTRRHVSSELAAWLMTIVLAVLAVRWAQYTGELSGMDRSTLFALAQSESGWIRFN